MTPQAQRIAIAEACGWTLKPDAYRDWWYPPKENASPRTELPDFPNDLNAMHEAEKTLTEGQKWAYFHRLAQMAGEDTKDGNCTMLTARIMLGWDAASKAQAFLRTLGKWE